MSKERIDACRCVCRFLTTIREGITAAGRLHVCELSRGSFDNNALAPTSPRPWLRLKVEAHQVLSSQSQDFNLHKCRALP